MRECKKLARSWKCVKTNLFSHAVKDATLLKNKKTRKHYEIT